MSLECEKHVECTYYIYTCVHEYTYGSGVGGYDGGYIRCCVCVYSMYITAVAMTLLT